MLFAVVGALVDTEGVAGGGAEVEGAELDTASVGCTELVLDGTLVDAVIIAFGAFESEVVATTILVDSQTATAINPKNTKTFISKMIF